MIAMVISFHMKLFWISHHDLLMLDLDTVETVLWAVDAYLSLDTLSMPKKST